MKGKWVLIITLIFGILLVFKGYPSHAQKQAKLFTIIYSNNINGEIEPCPT